MNAVSFLIAALFLSPSVFAVELTNWAKTVTVVAQGNRIDEDDARLAKYGVFLTTLIAFFLAEMGDKTQVATVALAARYSGIVAVVAGTTFGMMLANVPAVYLGERIANRVPLRLVHGIAAAVFALLGLATLLGAGAGLGL